jgi:hypothetical protein
MFGFRRHDSGLYRPIARALQPLKNINSDFISFRSGPAPFVNPAVAMVTGNCAFYERAAQPEAAEVIWTVERPTRRQLADAYAI